jgi:soluble lytic murein transglycosylase
LNTTRRASLAAALVLVAVGSVGPSAQQAGSVASPGDITLLPTNHPRVPASAADFWMVPPASSPRTPALSEFASAVKLEVDGSFAKALPILSKPLLTGHPLNDYAQYYRGLAQLRTGRPADAMQTFRALSATRPTGYLVEATALSEAEASEALGDFPAAIAIYERLGAAKSTAPDDVLLRLGRAAQAGHDNAKAFSAYSRLYFEFPFSDLAGAASAELDRWVNREPIADRGQRYKLELGRAERLFGARRYTPARMAFEALRDASRDDDRELIDLRLAECDYFLKRTRIAREALRPYLDKGSRQGEALYFFAVAQRDLGARAEYVSIARRVIDEFPTQSWAEEALNSLASDAVVQSDDAGADALFRELYSKFPGGRYAERAAWKVGWRAYRSGQYAETVRYFESAAAKFPRSDYRPTWLYWSGRAHEALNEPELARARYTLTATDYQNTYYGRLVAMRPDFPPLRKIDVGSDPAVPLPQNERVIRALLELGLYDQAIDELHFAQQAWGDSPAILATLAWIFEQQGRLETGERQFNLYRSAINTMKQAYPQFLAAGGEGLPKELLRVIYPIGYWDLIRKYSAERNLDPYLVAALVAQESTFVASIHSYAKAVGLMQLEPPTAREYARKLSMKYSARLLTNPESNIKLGTAFLADSVKQFGDVHLVLATYNAGMGNVRRWVADRPGLENAEFIDDIPFPQTQQYVKKILATAEDYRRLYGPESATSANR